MNSIRQLLIRYLPVAYGLVFIITGGNVYAADSTPVGNGQSSITYGSLPTTKLGHSEIQQILQLAFGAIGALSLLMIVISGFRYVVSDGDPQKMTGAKDGIIYALVGLAVAIAAESIVAFVAGNI
jgi:hypothetical protein